MTYLDYVGVRQFDEAGEVIGERRFLGLYASTAYTDSVTRIPLVADKVEEVIRRSGVAADSHTGKDLPRRPGDLPPRRALPVEHGRTLRHRDGDHPIAGAPPPALPPRDDFRRFVSRSSHPRDRYNTSVRTRMADLLCETFGGESVEFTARVSESALSRLQFVVRMPLGERVRHLTAAVSTASRSGSSR